MVAIHTRYSGPTDTRGSRIIARRMDWSQSHRVRVLTEPDDQYCDERSHLPAVKKLCKKYGWAGLLVCGGSDTGYVWVWVPRGYTGETGAGVYEI